MEIVDPLINRNHTVYELALLKLVSKTWQYNRSAASTVNRPPVLGLSRNAEETWTRSIFNGMGIQNVTVNGCRIKRHYIEHQKSEDFLSSIL